MEKVNVGVIIFVILSIIAAYLVYKEEFADKKFSVSLIMLIMIYFGFIFFMVYYKYL